MSPATPEPSEIAVVVNGEQSTIPAHTTLAALIESRGLAGKACAAEINRSLVPKREHSLREIAEGDTIELVTLVGGG